MSAREKALTSMAARLAGSRIRTAGRIEFVRDQGPVRRDLRVQEFRWDPDVHRNLAKTLWAIERAHGYSMAGLRLFSKMNSSEFSPDGLLGGRGYIQQVKDLRSSLSQAVEVLSSFSDTLHDEVSADHWKTALESNPSTGDIVEEAAEVKADPEGYVEQHFQQEVPSAPEEFDESSMNPKAEDFNPFSSEDQEQEQDESDEGGIQPWRTSSNQDSLAPPPGPKSGLPTDEGEQEAGLSSAEITMNTTGEAPRGNYAAAIRRIVDRHLRTAASRVFGDPVHVADSSIDPATLPGPRVMHVGPGESPEEFGYETDWWDRPSDDQLGEGFSQLERIYEDPATTDGVTGYSDPTRGDETTFKSMAARLARTAGSYSWLPGSRNEKLMPYYELGVTDADRDWMAANDSPDLPASLKPKAVKPSTDPMWDAIRTPNA